VSDHANKIIDYIESKSSSFIRSGLDSRLLDWSSSVTLSLCKADGPRDTLALAINLAIFSRELKDRIRKKCDVLKL